MILAWRNKPELKAILAWHNKPELKAEALAGMIRHRQQDDFIRGDYLAPRWGEKDIKPGDSVYQGCFHGCLTTDKLAEEAGVTVEEFVRDGYDQHFRSWHEEAQRLWGIPANLGSLLDHMFESMPDSACANFAVETIEAMQIGADLTGVCDDWARTVTEDPTYGYQELDKGDLGHTAVSFSEYLADNYAERQAIKDDSGGGVHPRYWEFYTDWHTWAAQKLIDIIRDAPIPVPQEA